MLDVDEQYDVCGYETLSIFLIREGNSRQKFIAYICTM